MSFTKKILSKLSELKSDSKTVFSFAINDLKKRYSGSIGGILWAYIQPLVAILVFWFVFEKGFRNSPVDDVPFILWLVPSYIAWTYANDAIMQSSNVLYEYNFLVKKVKFKIEILPVVKVCVALIVHTFFILFTATIYLIYRRPFNFMWFQTLYYTFALTMFLIGVSWLVSSLSVFWKDIGQIVNVLLQIGFWMTPVFWNPYTMNEAVVSVLKLNPLYYIVQGYRETFISGTPFYNFDHMTIYFWIFTVLLLALGLFTFKRLKKHFPDLL